jgi:hypothetical protein
MIYKYEKNLYDFFSDIIWVKENPCTILTRNIIKSGEEVKIEDSKKVVYLDEVSLLEESMNLMIPECGSGGIINQIRKKSKIINFNYCSKNIFQKIFNKSDKNLNQLISSEISENSFIISTKKICKNIKQPVYMFESNQIDEVGNRLLEDLIIIGEKSQIIINENFKNNDINPKLIELELSIDYSKFKVIVLK